MTTLGALRPARLAGNTASSKASRNAGDLGWVSLVTALLGIGVVVYWCWGPGVAYLDASGQIGEYISGRFVDWQSPLLSVVWGWSYSVLGYPLGPFLLDTALLLAAVGAWTTLLPLRWAGRCLVAALVVLWPPTLMQLDAVVRDVPFAAASLLAIALAVHARRRSLGHRWPWVVAAIVVLVGVVSFRQESVVAMLPVFGVLVAMPLRPLRRGAQAGRRRLRAATVALATAAAAAACFGATSLLAHEVIGARATDPFQFDELWDLASISVASGHDLVPVRFRDDVGMQFLRTHTGDVVGDPLFWPPRVAGAPHPHLVFRSDARDDAALERAWLRAVVGHPGAFVRHRTAVADWTLSISHPPPYALLPPLDYGASAGSGCVRYVGVHCGVPTSAGAHWLEILGTDHSTWLPMREWPYALAALAVIALCAARRSDRSDLLAVLCAASAVLEIGAQLAAGTDTAVYRFHEWPMLAAVAAVLSYGATRWARRTTPTPLSEPNPGLDAGAGGRDR